MIEFAKDLKRMVRRTQNLREMQRACQPLTVEEPRMRVVIEAANRGRFNGPGKVPALDFLPHFCAVLRERGAEIRLSVDVDSTAGHLDTGLPTALIRIYREVAMQPEDVAADGRPLAADVTFNAASVGRLIASKPETNRHLAAHGVPMPSMEVAEGALVFSNAAESTGDETEILQMQGLMDETRYNTEFVDTTVRHGGRAYYTSVRLLCVGPRIVHALPRSRPVEDGNASVRLGNTVRDAGLMAHLQERLVEDRWDQHLKIAAGIDAALGPAFYAHDLLVCARTGRVSVCETGFKLDYLNFRRQFAGMEAEMPFHALIFDPSRIARASADAFLDVCRERGLPA